MNSSAVERRLVMPRVESSNLSSSAKVLWQRWFYCTGLKDRQSKFDSLRHRQNKTKAMEQQKWRKLDGTRIKRAIEDEIRAVLVREKNAGHELKVCIGTDSQVKGNLTEFATVVVFIRKGKGGFMYILPEVGTRKFSVKERMLREVANSIDVAYGLASLFTRFGVDMEVHADINTNPAFKSNDALKEAMGYIVGMGFAFKAKPNAFASSSCANKVVQ
jgi:predicted RNase H-related nuclease YkuK (DUF458 family)